MKAADGAGLAENVQFNHSSNTSGNFCLEWSEDELVALEIVNICISAAGVLASAVAIIFILVSKGYKKFVHRLTLYLIVAVQFDGVVSILQAVPVYYSGTVVATREGLEGLCAATGFLSNIADWLELLIISWIVLYLVMVLVFKYSANAIRRKHEICGLVVVLILPFLFNWIPFLKSMYGLSGGDCWIKPSVNNYCDYDEVGLIFMFLLSYGPFLLVCLITLVSLGTIAIVMCKRALQQEQGSSQSSVHRQGLKEVLPLLLYPLSYFLLWIGEVMVRLYDVTHGKMLHYPLILTQDIISVIIILFVPLVFLLHASIRLCKMKQGRLSTMNTTTSFSVSNEFPDEEDKTLIIKGQGTIQAKEYKSVLEGSVQW